MNAPGQMINLLKIEANDERIKYMTYQIVMLIAGFFLGTSMFESRSERWRWTHGLRTGMPLPRAFS